MIPAEPYIKVIEAPQRRSRTRLHSLRLTNLMQHFGVPGLSIAVIADFKLHWAKAYGVVDCDSGALVDTQTRFQAASISKPIAAMAVLKVIEEGHFDLGDDVFRFLKSWRPSSTEFIDSVNVTPLSLMSHTSGLGDGFGYPGYVPGAALPTVYQILNGEPPCNVGATTFVRKPGSAWQYSGAGYTILQLLLEETLQETFANILKQKVLAPLGLNHTHFESDVSAHAGHNIAKAHDSQGLRFPYPWLQYPELAAAGLWSTATDLTKFIIEVQLSLLGQSNRVLSQNSVRSMVDSVGMGNYSAGFAVLKGAAEGKSGEGYFAHHGDNQGYKVWIAGHRSKGYGYALMCNGENGAAALQEIRSRLQRAYQWEVIE